MSRSLHLLVLILFLIACKKKIEVIKEVPVEKKTSWTEVKTLTGINKIILSTGANANAIYLQQPFFFFVFRSTDSINGLTSWGTALPTDVSIKMPIAPTFFAVPYYTIGTLVRVRSNLQPNTSPGGAAYDIKQLDSTATSLKTYFSPLFKCMAIDKNNFLLVPYYNNRPDHAFTLRLFSIKVSTDYPYIDTFFSRRVTIPNTTVDGDISYIAAVNNYFLVEISSAGIFKIGEDGTFKKVFDTRTVDAFYQWNGKVYVHVEWGKVLVSSDDAESFQEYSGINQITNLARYNVIKDSLVGAHNDGLFTLKWNNTEYTIRSLKNDGLEGTYINGIEILHDSVYAATTSGLFVKPVNKFFESK